MAKMQPPPRRVKHTVVLKNVHTEQLSKLQAKHQQETELLEDIRNFSKQRSIIEKEYAQALCKLAQQFLSKRQFPALNVPSQDGKEHKTVMTVWKTVLEETDRVGKMRLNGAETYLQQISEPFKPIKTAKQHMSKKVMEQCVVLQKEVGQSVLEMAKSNKIYHEDEHVSHEARVKFKEIDSKVKNKSTGLFTSLASLQQKSSKLNTRKETCEVKSTSSRNDYLLNLAAANAHQIRYYSTDLPELMALLDGEMYEKVREFFMLLARTELECCGLTQECFTKIMSDSGLISRPYNLQCFLHENHVYTDLIQYQFEAQDGDEVRTISTLHTAEEQVHRETRKWASKIAKENKAIRDYTREIQQLQEQGTAPTKHTESTSSEGATANQSPPVDPEVRIEELKQNIRKAETMKMRAEARIEALRAGGVNVDEWLNAAAAETLAVEEEEASQRSSSSVSVSRTDSEGPTSRIQSAADDIEPQPVNSQPNDSTYINYEEEDDFIDETFEGTEAASTLMTASNVDSSSTGYSSEKGFPIMCLALYDFEANNTDELSITEQEQVELVAEGDGDGWVKARKASGEVGFVPQNYIQVLETAPTGTVIDHNGVNVDSDSAGYDTMSSGRTASERVSAYSATDYEVQQTMDGHVTIPPTPPDIEIIAAPEVEPPPPEPATESAPPPESEPVVDQGGTSEGVWATALYDYEAQSQDELSFHAGQLIRITRKDNDGVDDGFWEGCVDGRYGVFPSLVVMELEAPDQDPGDSLGSPMGLGPPPFTPPEPGPPPPSLEITQPTPSDEGPTPPGKSPVEEFPPPLDDPAVSGAGGDAPTDPPDGSDDPLPPPPNDADLPPPPPEEPTQLGQPAQELGQTDPVAAGSEVTGSKPDDEVPDGSTVIYFYQPVTVATTPRKPHCKGQEHNEDGVVKLQRTPGGVVAEDEANGESII